MRTYLNAYVFRALQLGLGFVGASVTARLLGVAGRGELTALQTVVALAVFLCGLGIPTGVSVLVAREPERLRGLIGSSVAATMLLSGLCAILLALFWAPRVRLGNLIYAVYFGVAAQSLWMLISYLLLGMGEVAFFSRQEVYVRGGWLILLGSSVAIVKPNAFWVLSLQQVAYFLVLLACIRVLRRLAPGKPGLDWLALWAVLGLSLRSYAGQIAGFLLISQNILFLQHYRGHEEVGLLSAAILLGNLLCQAPAALYPVLFSEISALKDVRARWARARHTVLLVTLATAVAAVLLDLTGPILIKITSGQPFLKALPALRYTLIGSVFMAFSMSCQAIFNTSGQPLSLLTANYLAVLLNAYLCLRWIPPHGFVGAAQASAVSSAVWTLVVVIYLAAHSSRPASVSA